MESTTTADKPPCKHRWVHLRHGPSRETGYRRPTRADVFFCKKCLELRTLEVEISEKHTYGSY